MLESIRSAQHTVDMMTFVYWRGDIAQEFAEALAERARAGVRVRLLLDGFGCRLIEKDQLTMMERDGVQVAWFRKPLYLSPLKQNHRCHRKALVVDESTAFTGGVGIAEEWCGDARDENEWRDTHVRLQGAAVDGIAAAFAQNWAECHDELFDGRDRFVEHERQGSAIVQVVRGSASFGWQDMQTLMRVMLESAEERFRLTTAYFSPDAYFIDLLCAAARRGVEVEILLPGPYTDKRVCQLAGQHYYDELLACGVKILQYQPTMLHAKVITVDCGGLAHRVHQLQPPVARTRRGSHAGRPRRGVHRDPGRPFRRGRRRGASRSRAAAGSGGRCSSGPGRPRCSPSAGICERCRCP